MGLDWAIANINVNVNVNVNIKVKCVGSALPSGWAGPGQARGGRREPVHGGLVAASMRLTPPQTYPGPALDRLSVTENKSLELYSINVAWAELGHSCRNPRMHRHRRWPVVRSFGLAPAARWRAGA